jgi:PPK2 family polyphosphate:nucleotide phosphotransferase
MFGDAFKVKPGTPVRLSDYDPAYTGVYKRKQARKELVEWVEKIRDLQERLYAESKQALLVVFQAMDTGGKDGAIKRVFQGVNPQGVRVASFKKPTALELAHDYLWRVHAVTPPKGYIGVFNRSHYEDVLIVRVNSLVPEEVWSQRYEHINQFERLLADNNTRILKFFLNIGRDEQKKRLQRRLDRPDRHWKFDMGDLPVRERWDDYMAAYEAALSKCSTDYAPWYVIPANRRWYRSLTVARIIAETLEDMNPQFPPTDLDVENIVIPD